MPNRTGTYVAFDGLGEANPSKSDFKFYSILQGWAANTNIDFRMTNSHEKASAVRDSSKKSRLKTSIRKRLRSSKNMIVIISSMTRRAGSLLSYEIQMAVDRFYLPLVVVYPEYRIVRDAMALSDMWPNALRVRVRNRKAMAIHLGFKQRLVMDAIKSFGVNGEQLGSPISVYRMSVYRQLGIAKLSDSDNNYKSLT